MTAPVTRYTAAEMQQAARFLDRLAGDWEGGRENALRQAAAMLRQAAAEGQGNDAVVAALDAYRAEFVRVADHAQARRVALRATPTEPTPPPVKGEPR